MKSLALCVGDPWGAREHCSKTIERGRQKSNFGLSPIPAKLWNDVNCRGGARLILIILKPSEDVLEPKIDLHLIFPIFSFSKTPKTLFYEL